ncbi:MAG: SPOR domain-containing protein [Steroidobacteraceae bacterium]
MRTLLFALLTANLGFCAWAMLTPVAPPMANSPPPDVPRLKLASEASAAPSSTRGGEDGGASAAVPGAPAGAAALCRSIGPFGSEAEAGRAATAFSEGGYDARPRTEESREAEGFWVSLPAQRNAAAETRLLARLARAGITDASVMADTDTRRISVGIFSERERADRRAAELRRLGLAPDVTERLHIGTTWWVDLPLQTPQELAEAEAFNSEGSSQLELKPCPAAAGVAG